MPSVIIVAGKKSSSCSDTSNLYTYTLKLCGKKINMSSDTSEVTLSFLEPKYIEAYDKYAVYALRV